MFIFPKNLLYFVFLKHPFWDSPFSFITDQVPFYDVFSKDLRSFSTSQLRSSFF